MAKQCGGQTMGGPFSVEPQLGFQFLELSLPVRVLRLVALSAEPAVSIRFEPKSSTSTERDLLPLLALVGQCETGLQSHLANRIEPVSCVGL